VWRRRNKTMLLFETVHWGGCLNEDFNLNKKGAEK